MSQHKLAPGKHAGFESIGQRLGPERCCGQVHIDRSIAGLFQSLQLGIEWQQDNQGKQKGRHPSLIAYFRTKGAGFYREAWPSSTPLVEMKYFTSMFGRSHAGSV